jgi:hypothetical protein
VASTATNEDADLKIFWDTTPIFTLNKTGAITTTGTINAQTIGATSTFADVNISGTFNVGGGYGSTGLTLDTNGNLQLDGDIYLKGMVWRENLQELLVKNNTIRLNYGGSSQDAFIQVEGTGAVTLAQIKWDNLNSRWDLDKPLNVTGAISASGDVSGNTLTSTVATGTAPLTVISTTKVANLNVDSLDGKDESAFGTLAENETISGNWVNTAYPWADNEVADNLTISGGTINNTPIGATAASTGRFTTLEITSTGDALTLSGAGANIAFSGPGTAQIITATDQHLALMPGGTGKVGIGTSNPGAKLELSGTETNNGSAIRLTNTTPITGRPWEIISKDDGTADIVVVGAPNKVIASMGVK